MKQSGWGIASLVCGIAGVLLACVVIGIVPAIVGIVFAIIAFVQKNRGYGTAIGGLVCSIVGIIIFFLAMFVFTSDDTNDMPKKISSNEETQIQATEEKVNEPFKVGDTVETEDLRITFLKAEPYTEEYDEPAKGHEFYKFEFEFVNISDSDQYVSSMDFNCYADGYDTESAYSSKDKDLDATLSAGKKTKGVVCFEIPKDAKDISLEYETNYWNESKVCFEVKK
jgi:uncharacterized membrane protein